MRIKEVLGALFFVFVAACGGTELDVGRSESAATTPIAYPFVNGTTNGFSVHNAPSAWEAVSDSIQVGDDYVWSVTDGAIQTFTMADSLHPGPSSPTTMICIEANVGMVGGANGATARGEMTWRDGGGWTNWGYSLDFMVTQGTTTLISKCWMQPAGVDVNGWQALFKCGTTLVPCVQGFQ